MAVGSIIGVPALTYARKCATIQNSLYGVGVVNRKEKHKMKKAIREWWIYSSTVPFVMTVLIALLIWFGALQVYNFALRQGAKSCKSYATQTSRETRYVNMAWGEWSCMVNVNGNWIDRENVREIGVQP